MNTSVVDSIMEARRLLIDLSLRDSWRTSDDVWRSMGVLVHENTSIPTLAILRKLREIVENGH